MLYSNWIIHFFYHFSFFLIFVFALFLDISFVSESHQAWRGVRIVQMSQPVGRTSNNTTTIPKPAPKTTTSWVTPRQSQSWPNWSLFLITRPLLTKKLNPPQPTFNLLPLTSFLIHSKHHFCTHSPTSRTQTQQLTQQTHKLCHHSAKSERPLCHVCLVRLTIFFFIFSLVKAACYFVHFLSDLMTLLCSQSVFCSLVSGYSILNISSHTTQTD